MARLIPWARLIPRLADAGAFCGCCGRLRVPMPWLPDDYWCRPCRRHVEAPPGWT